VLIKIVCFLSAFLTINQMIVAACLFHDLSTAQHSITFFYTNRNSVPSVFRWTALYNWPKIRICQIKIILAAVNTPYLIFDGFYSEMYVYSPLACDSTRWWCWVRFTIDARVRQHDEVDWTHRHRMGLVSSACALPGDSVQDTNGAGCYAPNGLCYSLGKLDGDIGLSLQQASWWGLYQSTMAWCRSTRCMQASGCGCPGNRPHSAIEHVLIPFVAYTNAMRVGPQ